MGEQKGLELTPPSPFLPMSIFSCVPFPDEVSRPRSTLIAITFAHVRLALSLPRIRRRQTCRTRRGLLGSRGGSTPMSSSQRFGRRRASRMKVHLPRCLPRNCL